MDKVNPITPALVEQAFVEAHDSCKDGCIHLNAINEMAQTSVAALARREMREGRDPIFGAFFYGLHVGYRLAQLTTEPIDVAKAN